MLPVNIERFVHPAVSPSDLPKSPAELYELLDSGTASKEKIGAIVRDRYAETSALLDIRLYSATSLFKTPTNLVSSLARIGAFNYVRGIDVVKKDGTIDREVAPKIMLSPSAAIQVLDHAGIDSGSRALEVFSGVGYFSFFLAIEQPKVLDCVDIQTPDLYNLSETFNQAYHWVYGDLPENLKPAVTIPHFMQRDAQVLEGVRSDYTHVFMHPPYGRQSKLLMDLSEQGCKELWVNSLSQVARTNQVSFKTFSVVPSEWTQNLEIPHGHSGPVSRRLKETRMFPLDLYITEVRK